MPLQLFKCNLIMLWGHVRVRIFNQLMRDEPTKFLDIKIEYTRRAVVRLVYMFKCLAYDWMVKDE
jgi:hypothetical protein